MLKLEWKDIEGFEGLYLVSTYGQVKSLARTITKKNGTKQELKEKILKPILKNRYLQENNEDHDGGYLRVVLYKDGILIRKAVHILVAEAFIPNPEHKKEVGHNDMDKTNCRVDNLQWETRSENMTHMWKHGNRKRRD